LRRQFDRHRDIIAQGRPYRSVFILCSGFVWRYKILPDGKRQLLSFGLPGDLIGFPAAFFENAVNATGSLSDVVVATVPFAALYDLFARFPRVAVAL
jgi:CRP-like cAMP-binding protein